MKPSANSQASKRVLVIRIGHFGDSILATAIVEPLRAAFGQNTVIDFASGPGASAAILQLDRRINRVFPIARRRVNWRFNSLKAALRKYSRRSPYDLVINLECGDECNDFSRFISCEKFHGRPFSSVHHSFDRHCVDTEKLIYRELLGAAETDAAEPSVQPAAQADVENTGSKPRFVLLNPGFAAIGDPGYRSHRGWPMGHWAGLASLITGQTNMEVRVNGAASELAHLGPLLELPRVESLVGSSIADLATAIRAAECVISVDTGTMHLGAALGRPVIALFGPTIPALTGPYSRTSPCRVLTSGIDCQPCDRTPLQKRCTDNRCMAGLTPQAVFSALQGLLAACPNTPEVMSHDPIQ